MLDHAAIPTLRFERRLRIFRMIAFGSALAFVICFGSATLLDNWYREASCIEKAPGEPCPNRSPLLNPPEDARSFKAIYLILILVGLFVGPPVFLPYAFRSMFGRRYTFFMDSQGFGFVYPRKGKVFLPYQWSDLKDYSYTPLYRLVLWHRLRLVTSDGKQYEINNNFQNIEELLDAFFEISTPILLKDTLERLGAGEKVSFGGLAVSKEGIHHLGRLLHWYELMGADETRGNFYISRMDTTRSTTSNFAVIPLQYMRRQAVFDVLCQTMIARY